MVLDEKAAARFRAKVRQLGPDDCWPWQGTISEGYGRFYLSGKSELAHRVAFFLEHGRWPEPNGLHSCDNGICCNTRHLFEGTVADNNRDCVAKGRHARGDRHGARLHPETRPRGERNAATVLTENQVREIRSLHASLSYAQIAKRFGVSKTVVAYIQRRKTWRHVA